MHAQMTQTSVKQYSGGLREQERAGTNKALLLLGTYLIGSRCIRHDKLRVNCAKQVRLR